MIGVEDLHTYGWEAAIRGMRNPMNSWDKSDSAYCDGRGYLCDCCWEKPADEYAPCYLAGENKGRLFVLGKNDCKLAMSLAKAGPVHGKFLRMLTITMDVVAPLYWWKEFDTYKVGTVRNSCSTMHKIHSKEFTIDDFSHEHMIGSMSVLNKVIDCLNYNRDKFIETKDKRFWWQMIQLLPSSHNQRATIQMNYEVARNIIKYRKDHKLDEWREFYNILIEHLPYAKELIYEEVNDER